MSEKKPLLKVEFVGRRYADGSLDTDALKSLRAIEDAIRGIALDLYMQDHPAADPEAVKEMLADQIKFKITQEED